MHAEDIAHFRYINARARQVLEEREKLLLDIGERLNLRGGRMDVFHDKLLAAEREEAQASAMESLKEMSFTVIEGDFPPDVVANENIRFEPYRLKSRVAFCPPLSSECRVSRSGVSAE